MPVRRFLLLLAFALAASACSTGADLDQSASTTAPPSTAATSMPATSQTTTAAPGETTTTISPPEASPPTSAQSAPVAVDCAVTPPVAEPDPSRPSYSVDVSIDPVAGIVDGVLSVLFMPDLETDRLVFRLWPNAPRVAAGGGSIVAGPVSLSGVPVDSTQPDPTTLEVLLDEPLPAGRSIEASLPFQVIVPPDTSARVSRSGDSLRLGSGFPILAWEPGVGWATEAPTALYAEAASSPTADYRVAIDVPDGFDVLASGSPDADGVWTGMAIRDFAITVGRFSTATGVVDAPDPVEVTVGVHAGLVDDPGLYLDRTVAVLEQFSDTFGPYPWPTLTIAVVPDLSGGIEFPTHIMQGPDSLGRVLSHELGHMLFYSLAGNNQGRDPWLDEGLASLLEARADATTAEMESTFIPLDAQGLAGEPMTYWDQHGASYYRGVYVQGANAVEALGTDEQVDCILRWYLAATAYGIGTPEDFAAVAEQVVPDARQILGEYGLVGG